LQNFYTAVCRAYALLKLSSVCYNGGGGGGGGGGACFRVK